MKVIYDGTFEGFLTLVYDVYYTKLRPKEILKHEPEVLLFEPLHTVFTDTIKAQKVLLALKQKFEPEHYQRIFHAFLCDNDAFEMALLDFIVLGFTHQRSLNNITLPSIFKIHCLEKELLRLVHKLYGFTRFEELEDGSLYAKISSKYNVLPFLGEHFKKRLGNHTSYLHDIKRSLAYVKTDSHAFIHTVDSFEAPKFSLEEEQTKALWKTFFQHVSIENRRNEKLQKQQVPLLYRTYMSEFQQ